MTSPGAGTRSRSREASRGSCSRSSTRGWNEGIAWVPGMLAASISRHDGFAVYVSEDGGATVKEAARSTEHMRVAGQAGGYNRGGLSADGTLLCLQHAEHGDEMHEALRVIDRRTGATVADLVDEGKQLLSSAWSPIVGDRRLAVVHERSGIPQPALWDPITGEWTEISTGLDGEISVADWWPDASALLLSQLHDGRHRLHRFDLESEELTADRRTPRARWSGRRSGRTARCGCATRAVRPRSGSSTTPAPRCCRSRARRRRRAAPIDRSGSTTATATPCRGSS